MRVGVLWRRNRNVGLHERFLNTSIPDDSREEVERHCEGLEMAGHIAEIIEWDENPLRSSERIMGGKYDLIFNASSLEEVALLEVLKVPFTGSGIDLVALDKVARKIIVSYYGVPTPPFQVITRTEEDYQISIPTPVIVKPARGRNSCGITNESITEDPAKVLRQAAQIIEGLCQDALVETFIEGVEITVGILGNEDPQILALLEIEYTDAPTNTFEHKKDHEVFHYPPRISEEEKARICEAALTAYKGLRARDYARIDMILSRKDGNPYFLELNTFPGLHMKTGDEKHLHSSYIGTMARSLGWGPGEVYRRIIDLAARRWGLV